MIYKEICNPRMADCNINGKISYEGILHILEAVGSHHSDLADDNVMDGSKGGLAWILADWRIEIQRRPDSKDTLNVKTWIRAQVNDFNVFRDYIVEDKEGNVLIKAEAKIVLLDTATASLIRIDDRLYNAYQIEDKTVFDGIAGRLREVKDYTSERELILRRSDIDFNGHVHNTRYVDFALEALPKDVYDKDELNAIRIIYRKPIEKGVPFVTVKYAFDKTHKVGIYNHHEELCTLIEMK